ncbi:transmembrane and TPR repeat-containing protein 3-like isoform X3 [Varroa jacobsoni]|uniref:dolichyl-phosphate-mannose--protein mannosyltransferase n=1 Tax=Varroa destructor TaxID=109461 RepID=A0A7M7M6M7_VARDE|nr:transmembrane and TPR repeat-containing protein 3-like isoform X1 [Varroa destructor]XP_022688066.1 transmembrane and TPR repeat-containing protein 3-like isoform X3 [Varroa jacobsoni]XP_022688067.1 transmembrane and TPR repeat-containing protein 3-like isoform X3 [Varroa jacobsoni]
MSRNLQGSGDIPRSWECFISLSSSKKMHSSLGRSYRGSPVSSRPPSQGSSPSRPPSPEPPAPDEPDSFRPWTLVVAAIAGFVYLTTLPGDMVYDDVVAVKENTDVRSYTPLVNVFKNDFWGTPIYKEQSHKSYRPLTTLSFRANFAIDGLRPIGYHAVNVILHAAVSVLFLRLCGLLVNARTARVASLLFAVHPLHSEAVASVVGRAELLSGLFYLCALIYYINNYGNEKDENCYGKFNVATHWRRNVNTVLLSGAGMLCKEQAIMAVGVCCVYQTLRTYQNGCRFYSWHLVAFKRCAGLLSTAIALLAFRISIMGRHLPTFSSLDNPVSTMGLLIKQLTYHYLTALNGALFLYPNQLACDWTSGSVPPVTSILDARNLLTIGAYAFLAFAVRHVINNCRDQPAIGMALTLVALPYLPASNLFFPIGFVVAERVLYLPSMGLSLLVAIGWNRLYQLGVLRKLSFTALFIILAVHSVKTAVRNLDWQSEYRLYNSALKVHPGNVKMWNNLGRLHEKNSNLVEAYSYYNQAMRLQPGDVRGYLNMGRLLTTAGRLPEAEKVYRRARNLLPSANQGRVTVTQSHLQVFLNLAVLIAANHSRYEEADDLLREVIELRADFTEAYLTRGDLLLRHNRTTEAVRMYERAAAIDQDNPDTHYNLAVMLMDQGRNEEALSLFIKALDLDPRHEPSLVNSAILLQESGLTTSHPAINQRIRLMQRGEAQSPEQTYFNLAMLALENKDFAAAEDNFRKAIEIKGDMRSALFNLALLLSEQQRPLESMHFVEMLLNHHPFHIKGLLLLGDIYVNYLRDLTSAEECYEKILSVDPNNVKGAHNLCVVYVERGELNRAERCFRRVISLHPDAEYVQRHLQVTQTLLRNKSGLEPNTEQLLQPRFVTHVSYR